MSVRPVRRDRAQAGWALLGGAIFALGALVAAPLSGLEIGGLDADPQAHVTWPSLVAGTFLVGCFWWWLLVARPDRLSLRRGAVTGIIVGVTCYPTVLTLAELFRRDPARLAELLGGRVANVLQITVLAIATTGFAATIVFTLVGMLASVLLRSVYPPATRRALGVGGRTLWRALTVLAAALVVVLSLGFAWLSLLPLHGENLVRSRPPSVPAPSYAAALADFEAIRADEGRLPLNPRCLSKLLSHGSRVARVVVFFHGLTNCPAQLDELAPKLFKAGYNVYVPRLPGHGETDPMTTVLTEITAEGMVSATERAIDLAAGLGDQVYVAGLSGGGTMTMWAAQYRADVAHTIALAPFLGPHVVPTWANRAATNLLLLLPSVMFTWNPLEPEGPPGMEYAYPRVPTHALGQFMRMGEILLDSAQQAAPAAQGLGLLVSNADFAVNNRLALQVTSSWQAHGREVDIEVVPLAQGIVHDMIDPRQPDQNTDFVYALLLDMIQRHTDGTRP